MLDIFLAPGRTFSRLKEKPTWLIPIIVVLVFNMLMAFVASQYVDWDKQRKAAIEQMRERNMSEEQIQKATEGMEKFYTSPVMRYGVPVVSTLVVSIIGMLFLAVIYNVSLPLFGGTSDFKRMWAIVCSASLIAAPSAIVRGGLTLMKKSAEVTTSLALAAPGLKQGFLRALLTQLDLFEFWKFLLIALGLTVVFGVKKSKAYTLVFVVWIVIMLILSLLGMRAVGR